MTSEVVIERVRPGVAMIRLDAPARRNALRGDMARAFVAACHDVEAMPDVGAAVVTGGPVTFCAGADRALLAAVSRGAPGAGDDLEAVYEMFRVLRELRLPTVAAICGAAVGAGLNLALACSLRIAGDNAELRSGFVPNGIHPAGGHLRMLREIGGRALAVRMAVLDEPLSAHQATAAGLVLGTCPPDQAALWAIGLAARAAANPGLAREITESVNRVGRLSDAEASRFEADAQRRSLASREISS